MESTFQAPLNSNPPTAATQMISGVQKGNILFMSSSLSASVIPGVHALCKDGFWYWETVVLVQTLGLVAAQVFANSLDGFFQLTIMLVILMAGSLAMAHCIPLSKMALKLFRCALWRLSLDQN